MSEEIRKKAQLWLSDKFDATTRQEVQNLLDNDESELIESFYKDLEFGTGGLRGIMGVGTNRLNIYTIGMATQGLCNYLKVNFQEKNDLKVAIAHDSRNNSRLFAETTAQIFAANGIHAYLFDALRPTPELSFAIRHFGCQSGVVITASHNPKEYNGYKAYWEDGGQLIEPHDVNVIAEARKVAIEDIKFKGNPDLITIIGKEFDDLYVKKIKSLSLAPEAIARNANIGIVYTPIHGTGVKLVPDTLRTFGFKNIHAVAEQDVSDGNFPTVISPNPENAEALKMAIDKAKKVDAELVMATDPDADRVGIAVRNPKGNFVLLNGNQTATLLVYYLVKKWQDNGKLSGKEYIVKTIVTTELLRDIAQKANIKVYDVLTGFKYIAEIIKNNEGKTTFIGGGEESYGYLAGEFVRDKDAVMACALIAETAAWAKDNGKNLLDLLAEIYCEFGFYKEALVNIVRKGKDGAEAISKMMNDYRSTPPQKINNVEVVRIKDFQKSTDLDIATAKSTTIDLPKSNVLQFFLADGTKISIRPSGTEPKIKFYFGVRANLNNTADYAKTEAMLDKRIAAVVKALNLN